MEITFHLAPALASHLDALPEAQYVLEEFKEYKRLSIDHDDLPAPSQYSQTEYESLADTMGRDRYFVAPKNAKDVDLHHIHVWQDGCDWNGLTQWECTSDSYLIYSWRIRNDEHHFFVMDYFRSNAHDIYDAQNAKTIALWVTQAESFWAQL